jgi:hypothetical protein
MLEHVQVALVERDYKFVERIHASGFKMTPMNEIVINTSKANLAKFLGAVRPHRLLAKFTPERFGFLHSNKYVGLVSKQACGIQDVVALQTSSRTFIAEGLASHNSVNVVGYTPDYVTVVTWGKLQRMSWPFWAAYTDESWACLPNGWEQKPGINWAQLLEDINLVAKA